MLALFGFALLGTATTVALAWAVGGDPALTLLAAPAGGLMTVIVALLAELRAAGASPPRYRLRRQR
jgi:hypothetical protein